MTVQRLTCALSPRGRIRVHFKDEAEPAGGAKDAAARIVAAFSQGRGAGVLQLGAAEPDSALDPSLAYWRALGIEFVSGVCGVLAAPGDWAVPEPDIEVLEGLAEAVPPMRGAENVTVALLREVWEELGEALRQRAAEYEEGVDGYLRASHSVWHVAGRVCLHLAENRGDPDYPFAFLATWAKQVPGRSKPQYVPLGHALQEYAGARQREKLLALLRPVQRAAEHSALIADLMESGDLYHPLAWTPEEAYELLQEADTLERAGVVLRLPNWWRARTGARPVVSVTIGGNPPQGLGLSAMLDFDVAVTLGQETLSAEEIDELLQHGAGLAFVRGRWVEVNPERLEELLNVFGAAADAAARQGIGFGKAMRLLAGADLGGDVEVDLGDSAVWSEVVAGEWLSAQLDALRSPEVAEAIEAGAGLNAVLRPYQKRGVQWLFSLQALGLGGCLADDMGLGKTIQVIGLLSLLRAPNHDPDLLVVPASLVDNWRSEIARFAPTLKVLIGHSSRMPAARLRALPPEEVDAHDLVITTYGTVTRVPWMATRRWRNLILDEAQAIKNPAARQTRAVKALKSRWRVALTGTPVENRLGDLWSLFDFLNPGLLGSAKAFGAATKAMAGRSGDGWAPLRRLVGPYILRRLKTDRRIISDLPDKTEMRTYCLLSRSQAALYAEAVRALAQTLREADGMARRGAILAALMGFKQICNHPSQWLGDGGFEAEASGKFMRLTALCEPIADRQEKMLVFTQFRAMTEPLSHHLAGCFGRPGLVLHGGTPVRQRQERVRRFQEDEDVPFLVLSLKAGGTGLNLTAANHVVHFDRWWNPAVENQATDRAFRIGQRRNVLVHKFVCQGTIEERIDALIEQKQALSRAVLSGEAGPNLTELGDEALLAIVALDLEKAVAA